MEASISLDPKHAVPREYVVLNQYIISIPIRMDYSVIISVWHLDARQCSSEKVEEEVTAVGAVLEPEQSALNDWKIMTPIGLALAIPAINNGIYVINEETQLACCFALFCTSVYKFGGDMIGSYFDEKAAAILR